MPPTQTLQLGAGRDTSATREAGYSTGGSGANSGPTSAYATPAREVSNPVDIPAPGVPGGSANKDKDLPPVQPLNVPAAQAHRAPTARDGDYEEELYSAEPVSPLPGSFRTPNIRSPVGPVMPDFDDLMPRRRGSTAEPEGATGVKRKTSVVKRFKDRVVGT
jgi:hypothetical protein